MKLVRCYINPDKLAPLKEALFAQGAPGVSATEIMGIGKPMSQLERFMGEAHSAPKFYSKFQVDIILEDDQVEEFLKIICKVCFTGVLGDGKIFVIPVEEAVRIRTGERGKEALY
ncbi:MAG: P-II family nitrogen regulator [Nitrospinae bacterium]|nr:P-II family nitrogen regulator [Nitrospinota bacterium]